MEIEYVNEIEEAPIINNYEPTKKLKQKMTPKKIYYKSKPVEINSLRDFIDSYIKFH